MSGLRALGLATFVLVLSGNTGVSVAQPLYRSFSSLEHLLGNSTAVFIGVPRSLIDSEDGGVTFVEAKFSVDETLKGVHEEERTVPLNLGRTPNRIKHQISKLERCKSNNSRCLVIVLFQDQPAPHGQDQVFDLSDRSKLNVVTKELNFIDNVKTLVEICREYCNANPGTLLTQGVEFALPSNIAKKHLSYPSVMVTIPVDPSLKKLAESCLNSVEVEVRWSAQRALRYFGRSIRESSSHP